MLRYALTHRIVVTSLVWEKWHAIDDDVSPGTVVPQQSKRGGGGKLRADHERREGGGGDW